MLSRATSKSMLLFAAARITAKARAECIHIDALERDTRGLVHTTSLDHDVVVALPTLEVGVSRWVDCANQVFTIMTNELYRRMLFEVKIKISDMRSSFYVCFLC